ncbi:hypothetical protein P2R64_32300 [Priestia megaterium]|uniref:hypothetical protein n=1 Tax=Priestia megaterium TaxID=1404 RepID=UPI0023DBF661|nr:hypothetical protein [Priestia megaterium]MDF1964685.1 hypothetical protein [Priestia megaterium]
MCTIKRIIAALFSVLVVSTGTNAVITKLKEFALTKFDFVLTDNHVLLLSILVFLLLCVLLPAIYIAIKKAQQWFAKLQEKKDLKEQQIFNQRMNSYLESRNNLKG